MLQRTRRVGIRPISIGRALLAQLDIQFENLEVSAAIAPNYSITLHPEDAAELGTFEAELLSELRQAVTHHAAIEGYLLSGEVEVRFASDALLKRGTCRVDKIAPLTQETTAGVNDAFIVLADGQRFALTTDLVTVGRQSDCQILIDDNNVSRKHADIRRTTAGWVVSDRGSTNATKVNGEKIVNGRLLVNGDTIAFGSTNVRFEYS